MALGNQNEQITAGNARRTLGASGELQAIPSFQLGNLTAENWQLAYSQAFAELFGSDGIHKKEYDISQQLRSRLARYRSRLLLTFTNQDVDYQSHGGTGDSNDYERAEKLDQIVFAGPGEERKTNEEILREAGREILAAIPGSVAGLDNFGNDGREPSSDEVDTSTVTAETEG